MIQVKNLTKQFGPVLAIRNVSFEISRGEVVGFLGPNGAGKTTTMRMLTTALPATSGIARVANFDVMTQSMDVRRSIGYLPESVPLYPEMRVEEYLDYRAKLKGIERKARPNRLEYCLERCRIREVRRRLIGTLSKGYRQRVGLADAMIHDPPILIMDEPTAGLDPLQIRETLALIQELGKQHTILLSTHILSEVEAICQRVMIINMGRIGVDKPLAQLETDAVILLEVRGPAEQVESALRSVQGVTSLQSKKDSSGSVTEFVIHTQDDRDLREELSRCIAGKGWTIRRLEQRRRRLEDAFLEVFRRQDPLDDDHSQAGFGKHGRRP